MFQHIIETEWLYKHRHDKNLRIVDCRFHLGSPGKGHEEYISEHIEGAVYADLEKNLSGRVDVHGGRHPLPDMETFAAFLGSIGIANDTTVVAYDSQSGAMASRLWWLLKYAGHEKVYVLNGGYSNWKKRALPVSSEKPAVKPTIYHPYLQPSLLAVMEDVKKSMSDEHILLLDSREPERYAGVEEPIDKIAGHIPGALNKFWRERMDEREIWKPIDELKKHLSAFETYDEIIIYCGSGVTACSNVLALAEIGIKNVKLYAGSWSDWISYEGNLIETDVD